jgi:regulator of protease activity HflC (stomatin/prohibitin superfamily)
MQPSYHISTFIHTHTHTSQYEEASLGLAKSKANRRAVEVNNEIMLQKAEAEANTLRIVAEGKAQATIVEAKGNAQATVVEAKGDAEARQIEATSRNAAAQSMTDQFSKDYAMQGLKVDMLGAIKASTVTVLPDSVIGQALGAMKGEHKQ